MVCFQVFMPSGSPWGAACCLKIVMRSGYLCSLSHQVFCQTLKPGPFEYAVLGPCRDILHIGILKDSCVGHVSIFHWETVWQMWLRSCAANGVPGPYQNEQSPVRGNVGNIPPRPVHESGHFLLVFLMKYRENRHQQRGPLCVGNCGQPYAHCAGAFH